MFRRKQATILNSSSKNVTLDREKAGFFLLNGFGGKDSIVSFGPSSSSFTVLSLLRFFFRNLE